MGVLHAIQQTSPAVNSPRDCPFGCNGECSLKCADYIDYVLEKEGDVAAVVRGDLNVVPDRALGHYTHEKSPV